MTQRRRSRNERLSESGTIFSDRAAASDLRRGRLYAGISVVAWATTGLVQRSLSADTGTQVAGRSFFAFLAITLYVVAIERRRTINAWRSIGPQGALAAALIAIASGSFIIALNHTTVADVLMISACAPLVAGVLAWLILGETLAWRSVAAIVVAIGGVVLMIGGRHGSITGDVVALVMTVAYGAHVVVTRYQRNVSLAPAAALAQVIVVIVALPFVTWAIRTEDVGLLALLGAGSTAVGITTLVLAARLLPPAELTLILLLEVILGPLFVWAAYAEQPPVSTLLGGAIVLGAVLFQLLSATRTSPTRAEQGVEPARVVNEAAPADALAAPVTGSHQP